MSNTFILQTLTDEFMAINSELTLMTLKFNASVEYIKVMSNNSRAHQSLSKEINRMAEVIEQLHGELIATGAAIDAAKVALTNSAERPEGGLH